MTPVVLPGCNLWSDSRVCCCLLYSFLTVNDNTSHANHKRTHVDNCGLKEKISVSSTFLSNSSTLCSFFMNKGRFCLFFGANKGLWVPVLWP